MKPNRIVLTLWLCVVSLNVFAATPIDALLERIDKGASEKMLTERVKSDVDFFEITSKNGKPLIRGNN